MYLSRKESLSGKYNLMPGNQRVNRRSVLDLYPLFEYKTEGFPAVKFVSLDVFAGQPYINSEAYDARTTSCKPVDYDDVHILAAVKAQTDPDFDPAPYDSLNSETWQVFIPFRAIPLLTEPFF